MGVACCTSVSLGTDLAGVTVEVDGWTLVPLRDATAMTHMIAARDDDELRVTDIDVVLYIRTAAGWDAEAYDPSISKEDALLDLATEFVLPDPMNGDWMIDDLDVADVTGAAGDRAPFKTGFFTEDPLSEAASALDNPQPLIEAAESLGLASGGSLANSGNLTNPIDPQPTGCSCAVINCLQDSISAGVDAMIADSTLTPEQIDAIMNEEMQIAFGCCIYWISYYGPSDWQTSCGGWQLVDSNSIPGGGTNCDYERDVTMIRTRLAFKQCWDCTRFFVVQTQTHTGCQSTRETVIQGDPCPDPGDVGEPDGECVITDCGDAVTGPWTPSLPPCP